MKEIVFAGFGGQGVLTAGLILSDIAVLNGYNATWIPSYGSAMRGGTANCTVKFGKEYIYNPAQEAPNLLLAMNDLSFQAFSKLVPDGGQILVSDVVNTEKFNNPQVKIVQVPCIQIAKDLGHSKGANIVMTGAIVKLLGDFPMEEALDAMLRTFEKKGKGKFGEINRKAFEAGYNAVK